MTTATYNTAEPHPHDGDRTFSPGSSWIATGVGTEWQYPRTTRFNCQAGPWPELSAVHLNSRTAMRLFTAVFGSKVERGERWPTQRASVPKRRLGGGGSRSTESQRPGFVRSISLIEYLANDRTSTHSVPGTAGASGRGTHGETQDQGFSRIPCLATTCIMPGSRHRHRSRMQGWKVLGEASLERTPASDLY